MDVSFYISSNQEYFTTDLSMITDDSVDEYLEDPNLSVSDMINKVKRIFNCIFEFFSSCLLL
jgi:hypothetical protein